VKILLIGDIHLSERPPSSCTDSYCDDLFDLLAQAREIGRQRGVTAMVWAGDTFHHKAPNRVSHRLVQRTCEYISSCSFPVLVLAGNHDLANDRYDSIFESQPLGTLFRAGAIELKGWDSSEYRLPVYGVPWLQGYGNYAAYDGEDPLSPIEVRLSDALKGYYEQVYEFGTGSHVPLVVAHAPLYPEGKELQYEYFPARRWAEAMGAWRGGRHAVYYGHVHEPHGEYGFYGADMDSGDYSITFCNNGALSRGSLHEYNLTRKVGVTLYDTREGTFEFVPLAARPAEEVFRLEEKGRVTDVQGRLDDFLSSVGSTSLEVMNAESVIAHVRSLGLGREVEALVEELLAEAAHGKGN
jgi:3',5'-cyclic AMP phosphodiesterase CpdA